MLESTLVKILCGVYQPDEGSIYLDTKKHIISDPTSSLKLGISAIHQESVMFDELSVMENIFIGNHIVKKNRLVDWSAMEKKTKDLLSNCLLYTSPSPRDQRGSRMPSSA